MMFEYSLGYYLCFFGTRLMSNNSAFVNLIGASVVVETVQSARCDGYHNIWESSKVQPNSTALCRTCIDSLSSRGP